MLDQWYTVQYTVSKWTWSCCISKLSGGEVGSRRKRRLMEDDAKCRHLKKLTCTETLRQVFICLMSRTPYPIPPYTGAQYTVLILTGKGGGDSWIRDKRGKRSIFLDDDILLWCLYSQLVHAQAVFNYIDRILPITAPVSLGNEEVNDCTVFLIASLQYVKF
jgi:hypothetical protein